MISVSPSDGLSVERLTLLGKVHIARVMVDTLSLDSMMDDDQPGSAQVSNVRSNRASRLRGKPPRPVVPRVKKKRYGTQAFIPFGRLPNVPFRCPPLVQLVAHQS